MGESEAYCVNVSECGNYTSDPGNDWMCSDCIDEIKSERDALRSLLKSIVESDDNEDIDGYREVMTEARKLFREDKPDGETPGF